MTNQQNPYQIETEKTRPKNPNKFLKKIRDTAFVLGFSAIYSLMGTSIGSGINWAIQKSEKQERLIQKYNPYELVKNDFEAGLYYEAAGGLTPEKLKNWTSKKHFYKLYKDTLSKDPEVQRYVEFLRKQIEAEESLPSAASLESITSNSGLTGAGIGTGVGLLINSLLLRSCNKYQKERKEKEEKDQENA